MSKITVIGAGNVGATIANDLMIQGIASEIVLIDINRPKAFGEALDIYQGVPYCARRPSSVPATIPRPRIPTSSSSRPACRARPASPGWSWRRSTSIS